MCRPSPSHQHQHQYLHLHPSPPTTNSPRRRSTSRSTYPWMSCHVCLICARTAVAAARRGCAVTERECRANHRSPWGHPSTRRPIKKKVAGGSAAKPQEQRRSAAAVPPRRGSDPRSAGLGRRRFDIVRFDLHGLGKHDCLGRPGAGQGIKILEKKRVFVLDTYTDGTDRCVVSVSRLDTRSASCVGCCFVVSRAFLVTQTYRRWRVICCFVCSSFVSSSFSLHRVYPCFA